MPRRGHVESPVTLRVINETGRKTITATESFDAAGNMIVRLTDVGTCLWREDVDTGGWAPECGRDSHMMFQFTDGGPVRNHFTFCPYCGRSLKEERT
jgi:hypothetical protein